MMLPTIISMLLSAAAVITFGSWVLGIYIARAFAYSRSKSLEETYRMSLEFGDYTEEEFASIPKKECVIPSPYGYHLTGVIIPNEDPRGLCILCHGHTYTWHGMVKHISMFKERKYIILAYNHRYHGTSGGDCCSAGYYEKEDLKAAADWLLEQYPQFSSFGLMGESMGAATALQYLDKQDERLSFVIADCPYSDMNDLYRYKLRRHWIPSFLHPIILWFTHRYLANRAGFSTYDVSPKASILRSRTPVLLMHGDADTYVPTWMSEEMHALRNETAPTYLRLVEGAKHAQSWATDPEGCRECVHRFLNNIS